APDLSFPVFVGSAVCCFTSCQAVKTVGVPSRRKGTLEWAHCEQVQCLADGLQGVTNCIGRSCVRNWEAPCLVCGGRRATDGLNWTWTSGPSPNIEFRAIAAAYTSATFRAVGQPSCCCMDFRTTRTFMTTSFHT